jgi:hypothetical protein
MLRPILAKERRDVTSAARFPLPARGERVRVRGSHMGKPIIREAPAITPVLAFEAAR